MEPFIVPSVTAILSIIVGSVGYMIKNIHGRLDSLEKFPAVTEHQTRQIVADKMDPMKEDLNEIRTKIDYILNLIYTSNK